MTAQLPKKLRFLFEPHRYKVVYGGRGGAKSWNFARALLIRGAHNRERILCAREIQRSIRDSVHRLLCDQIQQLGLGDFYDVTETEIRGRNGTEFIFSGLAGHTVESLKSYEGVSLCWVEEAQTVTKRSWDILAPTIRKEGSEIWVSFNPGLDTDETWVRFVVNPPPGAKVVKMKYADNPWFPEVLEQERQHTFTTSTSEDYVNIWEGECRTSVIGAIYAQEMQRVAQDGRICHLPYDPRFKVHTIWDLGWNDSMAIIFIQRGLSECRIIGYIESTYRTLDWYAGLLKSKNLNWGKDILPHDGKAADFKTGKTAQEILRAFGRKVDVLPLTPVEVGIKAARMLFARTYFDSTPAVELEKGRGGYSGVGRLLECLKRYRRNVSTNGEPGSPVHDEYSHGADAFRHLGLVVDKLTNADERVIPRVQPFQPTDATMGVLG